MRSYLVLACLGVLLFISGGCTLEHAKKVGFVDRAMAKDLRVRNQIECEAGKHWDPEAVDPTGELQGDCVPDKKR